MKKLSLFILLFLLSTSSFAQKTMSIKGIPIDRTSTFERMKQQLQNKGFTFTGYNDSNEMCFQGSLAGFDDVCVVLTENEFHKDLVYFIEVYFPQATSWKQLATNYEELYSLLTQRYGRPTDKNTSLYNSYRYTDEEKMQKILNDGCDDHISWETSSWYISLYLGDRFGHTFMFYINTDNYKACQTGVVNDI